MMLHKDDNSVASVATGAPHVTDQTIEPLAVPITKGHQLVGGSQSSFYKTWIGEGWVKPVDLGGRGQCVIVAEVKAAMLKRAEAIRSGEIVPPIRSARGKKSLA
jgi:hypothetical protein